MKNIKALGLLLLALLIGLAAAFYASAWAGRQGAGQTRQVVIAAVDIELGTRINPQMLATVDWPGNAIPTDAFQDIKDVQDRVVKVGLLRGDAVVERKLAAAGSKGGLSAVIAEGKRAMTVRVNDVVGVAGFALPGTYVDVMVNAEQDRHRGDEGRQISKTVLEQVLVLAVAQEAGRDDTKPRVVSAVTLELLPEDAEKLDLARSVGTLSLVLRNQVDRQSVPTAGVTKRQLLEGAAPAPIKVASVPAAKPRAAPSSATTPAPAPVAAPQKQRDCIEVIHAGARVMNCF